MTENRHNKLRLNIRRSLSWAVFVFFPVLFLIPQAVNAQTAASQLSITVPSGWTSSSAGQGSGVTFYHSPDNQADITVSPIVPTASSASAPNSLLGALSQTLGNQYGTIFSSDNATDVEFVKNSIDTNPGTTGLITTYTYNETYTGANGAPASAPREVQTEIEQIGGQYYSIVSNAPQGDWTADSAIFSAADHSAKVSQSPSPSSSGSGSSLVVTGPIVLPQSCDIDSLSRAIITSRLYPQTSASGMLTVASRSGNDTLYTIQYSLSNANVIDAYDTTDNIHLTSSNPSLAQKAIYNLAVTEAETSFQDDLVCGLSGLGSLEAYLSSPSVTQAAHPADSIVDTGWFVDTGILGSIDGSDPDTLTRYTANNDYVTVETRKIGAGSVDQALGEAGDVIIDYKAIDVASGFILEKVDVTYPANGITSVNNIDTGTTIEDWIDNHSKATTFDEEDYSYDFVDGGTATLKKPGTAPTGSSPTSPASSTPATPSLPGNSAPNQNCVLVSGSGPDKIVFMSTIGSGLSGDDLLAEAQTTVGTLLSIDPYDSYKNQFSFYADMQSYPNSVTSEDPSGYAAISSCRTSVPETDVILANDSSISLPGWTSQGGETVFLNHVTSSQTPIGTLLAHFLGIAMGGLNEEVSSIVDITSKGTSVLNNCSADPSSGFENNVGVLYGSTTISGCNGSGVYYRPSPQSIMDSVLNNFPSSPDGTNLSDFNVISCGYLVAGIFGQPITKSNAETYWPQCTLMNTVKDSVTGQSGSQPGSQSGTGTSTASTSTNPTNSTGSTTPATSTPTTTGGGEGSSTNPTGSSTPNTPNTPSSSTPATPTPGTPGGPNTPVSTIPPSPPIVGIGTPGSFMPIPSDPGTGTGTPITVIITPYEPSPGDPISTPVPGLPVDPGNSEPPVIIFAVPSSTPPGTYIVQAGTPGGSWNTPKAIQINNAPLSASVVGSVGPVHPTAVQKADIIKAGVVAEKVIEAGGVIAGAAAVLASLFGGPFNLSELLLALSRLWGVFLIFFGIRKRAQPWGTVYDSVTKQPIDPAYITLRDAAGNQVSDVITDIDGRYGFLLQAGTYSITAGKSNYVFPSKIMAGRSGDELYNGLYFGEPITVTQPDQVFEKNIPMDAVDFDWNEFNKGRQNLMSFHVRHEKGIIHCINGIFAFGLILSIIAAIFSPSFFNILLVVIYAIISVFLMIGLRMRASGVITDKDTGAPLPFSVVRIFGADKQTEVNHKVADRFGRYYCLVPKGPLFISVEKKNADGSYAKVVDMQPVSGNSGIIRDNWKI